LGKYIYNWEERATMCDCRCRMCCCYWTGVLTQYHWFYSSSLYSLLIHVQTIHWFYSWNWQHTCLLAGSTTSLC
jgi:hypothetical protein